MSVEVNETAKRFKDLIDNIPRANVSDINSACEIALARIDEFSHMLTKVVFFFFFFF
jgi:hypothetical protein